MLKERAPTHWIGRLRPPSTFAKENCSWYYPYMSFKTTRKQIVEEVEYGMYVWRLPSGDVLRDEDGNTMNVFCLRKEIRPKGKQLIIDAAKAYGFPYGTPEWWSGKRPISDEELEEQRQRELFGLIADPLDYAAVAEEQKRKYIHGR